MADVLEIARRYAPLTRSVLLRGDVTTSRALLAALTGEAVAVREISCPLLPTAPGSLRGVLKNVERDLRNESLVAFVEIDHLSQEDQKLIIVLARDRVIDTHGRRISARLVYQYDPRFGSFSAVPGTFLELDVPPLAHRAADAVVVFARLLERAVKQPVRMDGLAIEAFEGHSWPGDVPEVLRLVEEVASRWSGPRSTPLSIKDIDLPHVTGAQRRARTQVTSGRMLEDMLAEYEAEIIALVMARCAGNKSRAARELGISRSYLIQKCQKYDID